MHKGFTHPWKVYKNGVPLLWPILSLQGPELSLTGFPVFILFLLKSFMPCAHSQLM